MRAVAVSFAILGLTGCSAIPRKMLGRFDASPDFIVVEAGGKIFWSPNTQAGGDLRFVGIGAADKGQPGLLNVITVSTSQLWPEITYSPDYSRITVEWRERVAGASAGRSVEFVKGSDK